MTILLVVLAVVSTFVMCVAFYGIGLRQGAPRGHRRSEAVEATAMIDFWTWMAIGTPICAVLLWVFGRRIGPRETTKEELLRRIYEGD